MIGPKEWNKLQLEFRNLSPVIRLKRLKETMIQTADPKMRTEISELISKVDIEVGGRVVRQPKQAELSRPPETLEGIVKVDLSGDDEEIARERTVEEIADEDSDLSDKDVDEITLTYGKLEEDGDNSDLLYSSLNEREAVYSQESEAYRMGAQPEEDLNDESPTYLRRS
tara:strand:+ start:4818 stop:5324 length:507 start_codon:yes stop_codon:yes gene_type:complete